MVELLSRLNPSDLATVLLVSVSVLLGGVIIVAINAIRAVQRYRERYIAASIVAEMLDRDIPTQEIVSVLNAMHLEGAWESGSSVSDQGSGASSKMRNTAHRMRRSMWMACAGAARAHRDR